MSSLSHSTSHYLGLKLRKFYHSLSLPFYFYVVIFNPGPGSNTFRVCTLKICALFNPLKYTSIADLAESRHIDLFALTETWITSSSTGAELFNATPPGFTLISCPRPTPATNSHIVSGAQHFSFVNLLLFFLHLLKPSSHLICQLSLSNSSDLI